MKRLILAIAATLMVTAANAQIVSSTSRTISVEKKVNRGWSELYLGYDFDKVSYDGNKMDLSNTVSLGVACAIPVSSNRPIFVRPGVAAQYSFGDDNYDGLWWLSIAPACDLGYLLTPISNVSVFPYLGLKARGNVYGENYYGYSLFASDELDWNRFQVGWRIGCDFQLSRIIFGIGYGADFSEIADENKLSCVSLKLGLKF